MSPITVRQGTPADLDHLSRLFDRYRQFYGQPSDLGAARAFLHERFAYGQSVLLLATDGTEAVGFAQLYPTFSSLSLSRMFILNDLFVVPGHRKQGIGRKLLQASTDHARSVGATHLTLSTATTNLTAQALYVAAGWRRDDQFLVYELALTDAPPLT